MKKIVIIGSGISGLSLGIFLLKKGFNVEIYEKNESAGGCCGGWIRKGYYIDNCMHWLTGTNQHTKLFKLWNEIGALELNSPLYQEDYFYKTNYNNQSISLYKDTEKTRKEMYSLSTNNGVIIDKQEIDLFINIINKAINFYNNSNSFKKILSFIKIYKNYINLSLNDLQVRFKTPILKELFTSYFPGKYSTLALVFSYATFASGNGKIYQNGSKEFVSNIVNKFKNLNGKLFLNSEVVKINHLDNKIHSITLRDNTNIYGDIFISTASIDYTYTELLKDYSYPKKYLNKILNKDDYPTISSFHIAFIVKKPLRPFKDTEIIEIDDLLIASKNRNKLIIKEYNYLNTDKDYTLYQIMIMQDEDDYLYWKELYNNKEKYDITKSYLSKIILDNIISKNISLKNNISILDCWTPFTYNKYFNLYNGSYMAFMYTKKSEFNNLSFKTKYKNLYLCTIWQSYTGGLPIALKQGYNLSKIIN